MEANLSFSAQYSLRLPFSPAHDYKICKRHGIGDTLYGVRSSGTFLHSLQRLKSGFGASPLLHRCRSNRVPYEGGNMWDATTRHRHKLDVMLIWIHLKLEPLRLSF